MTVVISPDDGSVIVNEHDFIGSFTVKMTTPLGAASTPNVRGQVLFVIVTVPVAIVEIVTGPVVAFIKPTVGKVPST
jgi:hypothetical protein